MDPKRNCKKMIKNKSKQFVKILMIKGTINCINFIRKERKQFIKIWMMKPNRKHVKQLRKNGNKLR